MKLNRLFAGAALLVLLPVHSDALTTTSPGKSSAFISESGVLDGGGNITPFLTVTIDKGKKKQVLEIEATVTVNGAPSLDSVYVGFAVNGIDVTTPSYPDSQCDDTSVFRCTITSTFWLDIDAAEIANPGLYVGQPLTIVMSGGNAVVAGAGLGYTATFSAKMVKK